MGFLAHLSSHGGHQAVGDNGDDVASYMPLGIDGYTPSNTIPREHQDFKYKLPLMSPSRGHIVLRRDVVGDISSRPNVYMPIWKAPHRGKINVNIGGTALNPMNSYAAGQVNVNQFIANSDLSQTTAATFLQQKNARAIPVSFSQTAGD